MATTAKIPRRKAITLDWLPDPESDQIRFAAKLPPSERVEVSLEAVSGDWWFQVQCFDSDGRQLFRRLGEHLASVDAARAAAELAYDAWRRQKSKETAARFKQVRSA